MIPVFLLGSRHTGGSLLLRCLDDHPQIVGMNDSGISTLCYKPGAANYNRRAMKLHGFDLRETVQLNSQIRRADFGSILNWSKCVFTRLKELTEKPDAKYLVLRESDWIGPPDVCGNYRVLTLRDPRSVWASGAKKRGRAEDGEEALKRIGRNWMRVAQHDCKRTVFVRYEDFVTDPQREMEKVCSLIRVEPDYKFLFREPRKLDSRFKHSPGAVSSIYSEQLDSWKNIIPKTVAIRIANTSPYRDIMERFGYLD